MKNPMIINYPVNLNYRLTLAASAFNPTAGPSDSVPASAPAPAAASRAAAPMSVTATAFRPQSKPGGFSENAAAFTPQHSQNDLGAGEGSITLSTQ